MRPHTWFWLRIRDLVHGVIRWALAGEQVQGRERHHPATHGQQHPVRCTCVPHVRAALRTDAHTYIFAGINYSQMGVCWVTVWSLSDLT